MLKVVVILVKCTSRIIRRVYKNTFNLACVILFQGTKCEQVVSVDKHITRPRFAVGQRSGFNLAIGESRIFDKYAWFDGRTLVILPYPRQFQFIWFLCHLPN